MQHGCHAHISPFNSQFEPKISWWALFVSACKLRSVRKDGYIIFQFYDGKNMIKSSKWTRPRRIRQVFTKKKTTQSQMKPYFKHVPSPHAANNQWLRLLLFHRLRYCCSCWQPSGCLSYTRALILILFIFASSLLTLLPFVQLGSASSHCEDASICTSARKIRVGGNEETIFMLPLAHVLLLLI